MDDLKNIALLIDADNTQLPKLEAVVREISAHGRIVLKRAYGNWAKETLKNWPSELMRLGIKAEQQFDYVKGKNATDMALVIDAMKQLYKNRYDAFVIVSSDSDYTPLAITLRESGVYVMGVGIKSTVEAFRNSCDDFLFLENLSLSDKVDAESQTVIETPEPPIAVKTETTEAEPQQAEAAAALPETEEEAAAVPEEIHMLLKTAWRNYQDDDEYVNVAAAGPYIKRVKSDFDARTYGYEKLPKLIEAFPERYKIKKYRGKGTTNIIAYKCL